jgi:homoserine kinase
MKTPTIRVPATSANLGPGFDCLGVAVSLYNTIRVAEADVFPSDPFLMGAADLFFKAARKKRSPFAIAIKGAVPRSRGLGSSVTVRLGLLAGLNELHGRPLEQESLLDLTVELEGHPDNAVPAFHGGFCACRDGAFAHFPVSPKLHFVTIVPAKELETKAARKVLPATITRAEAVTNLQNTAYITAAFALKDYEGLRDAFADTIHQPYRAKLLPGMNESIAAAVKAGAIGAFLSGSGSTLMALTLKNPKAVAASMVRALKAKGHKDVAVHLLKADNQGMTVSS